MLELELLSVVALLEDFVGKGLRRGQVCTGGEGLGPRCVRGEFSNDEGRTYASLSLRADQLLQLQHEPSRQAA